MDGRTKKAKMRDAPASPSRQNCRGEFEALLTSSNVEAEAKPICPVDRINHSHPISASMGKAKSAKAVERKRKKLLAIQAAQRVQESIAKASAVTNPLSGLPDAFLTYEVRPTPNPKPAARGKSGGDGNVVASEVPSPSSSAAEVPVAEDGVNAKVTFYPSPLPTDLHDSCLRLFERNMADMYLDSSWGLDLDEKAAELRHETARFLIVEEADAVAGCGDDTNSNNKRNVLAFSHFRFEPNDEDRPTQQVLYVYEIQVSSQAQRSGLGKRLMNIMELIALKLDMKKIMLTVFKNNGAAMSFYLDRMKYEIDESSPSNFDGEVADYEILSKTIGK